ncbi:MAG: aldo/keto reductase [Anaerolineae bacterium]|nr:aldo/keto reductase [Anaerolineae bacterium]
MKYRLFGKLGWQVSVLGFGCMRFPKTEAGRIDVPAAERMVKYAVEQGVNYLDTAYVYHEGESEHFLGEILKGGWRQKVHLATKLPCWEAKTPLDFDRLLNEQLQKLQTDYIDVYLLHALDGQSWQRMRGLGVLEWLCKIKTEGKVRAIGFSFHDCFEVFKEIIDAYEDWDVCQIQYNYMNQNYQAGTRGLEYAAARRLGVVIMEPLLGGKLANPPQRICHLFETFPRKASPAEWSLQWLWNRTEVSVVLSGMSSMEQVAENVRSASRSAPESMSREELVLFEKVQKTFEAIAPVPCTACGYCLPCPSGVNIPENFSVFNKGVMYDDLEAARWEYQSLKQNQGEASVAEACIQCGTCEPKCPQKIAISQWMPRIDAVLGKGQTYNP